MCVERATDALKDSIGSVQPSFNTLCRRFAELTVTNGREFQAALQTVPLLQAILKLPYDEKTETITARDRIKIGSRVLNIAAIWNEGENNERIVVWCVEEADA